MPMTASTFALWLSRLTSVANAIIAPAMAPAPCNIRPTISHAIVSALAATKLPNANTAKPNKMTGLRPHLSDIIPIGICKAACVKPYPPTANPTIRGE